MFSIFKVRYLVTVCVGGIIPGDLVDGIPVDFLLFCGGVCGLQSLLVKGHLLVSSAFYFNPCSDLGVMTLTNCTLPYHKFLLGRLIVSA